MAATKTTNGKALSLDSAPRTRRSASTATVDDDHASVLRGSLSAIKSICADVLADRDDRPEEFGVRINEILDAADDGLQIVDEQLPHLADPQKRERLVKRLGDDLPHKILKIYYRCESLLKSDEQWFSPYATPLQSILDHYAECRAAIKKLLSANSEAQTAAGPARPAEAPSHDHRPTATDGSAAGEVLVVEDDEDSRCRLVELLQGLNLSVKCVVDGQEALNHLDKYSCDLVLLDLHMDGVDGCAVLREMREDYGLRAIPVIVISAADDDVSAIRCIELGADDYLSKPFDRGLLQARVASCLDKGAMRRNDRALHDELLRTKSQTEDLLYQVFPYTVAQELRTGGQVQPRGCDNVAVLFCDLVGFTTFCSGKPAAIIVELLQKLFTAFEEAVDRAGVEKIKTIGDCFMITAGVLGKFTNPVEACLRCAQEMRRAAESSEPKWDVRIGIHVGPLVAGMVGRKQFAFDVWGDTVNTAARIQTAAEPGMIALSEPAWSQVYQQCRGKSIGAKSLKGKNSMEIFRFDAFR